MQVNRYKALDRLQLQPDSLKKCFSLFAPYSDTSRLWIDHKVTQHPSDIENPSSSNGL